MKILWAVAALLVAANAVAQNGEPAAVLGNSSRGGSSDSGRDQRSFQHAVELAKQSGRDAPTVEQLLLALLDDESVRELLSSQYIDVEAVRGSLRSHVESQPIVAEGADPKGIEPKVRDAMQRAMMKSAVTNRKVSNADLVVAILVEGDSFAARTLAASGLTVQEAEDASLELFLAKQREQDRRVADMQRRIEAEAARPPSTGPVPAQLQASVSTEPPIEPKTYILRVTSSEPKALRFKGAVSRDGTLDLYIESTPFEIELTASRIAALFEAIDQGGLRAELVTEIGGARRTVSGSTGASVAIFEDLHDRHSQRSGVLR